MKPQAMCSVDLPQNRLGILHGGTIASMGMLVLLNFSILGYMEASAYLDMTISRPWRLSSRGLTRTIRHRRINRFKW